MPALYAKAEAMLGIQSSNNAVRVSFRDSQNQAYTIELPEHLLGGLMIGLRNAAQSLSPQAGGSIQVMTLNSGQPFRLPDGRIGLELRIDDSFRLPLIFPKEAIATLRRSLDELERQSSGTPQEGPRSH